jgi:hypothetical protein
VQPLEHLNLAYRQRRGKLYQRPVKGLRSVSRSSRSTHSERALIRFIAPSLKGALALIAGQRK